MLTKHMQNLVFWQYYSINAINQWLSYIFNIFDRYGLVTDYDYTDYFNSLDTRVAKRTDGYNDVSSGLEIGVINFSFEFDVDLIFINLYIIISILDKYSFYSLFWLRDLLVYQQLPRRCMSTISRQKLMITRILQIPWKQDIQLWAKITKVLTTIKLKHVLR